MLTHSQPSTVLTNHRHGLNEGQVSAQIGVVCIEVLFITGVQDDEVIQTSLYPGNNTVVALPRFGRVAISGGIGLQNELPPISIWSEGRAWCGVGEQKSCHEPMTTDW